MNPPQSHAITFGNTASLTWDSSGCVTGGNTFGGSTTAPSSTWWTQQTIGGTAAQITGTQTIATFPSTTFPSAEAEMTELGPCDDFHEVGKSGVCGCGHVYDEHPDRTKDLLLALREKLAG